MRILMGLVVLGLCCVSVSQVKAATYYFAAKGNDQNSCTVKAPCKSLTKLNQLLRRPRSGDVYLMRGGDVFQGKGRPCVLADQNGITLSSYGQGRAILMNCDHGIKGTGDHWHISGLEVEQSTLGIECVGCQDWVVEDMYIHDVKRICINFHNSKKILFKENICQDTGSGGGQGEGFYLVDVQDVKVIGNTFTRLYDEGVNCKGKTQGLTIQENYFHDFFGPRPKKKSISLLSWLIPSAMAGQTPSEDTAINCRHAGTQDVLVERNLIENMPNTGVRMHRVKNAIVRNNTIKNGKVGIDFDYGTTGEISNNELSGNGTDYRLGQTDVEPQ